MMLEIIQQGPPTVLNATPLLFVHGAWHGAWCWEAHFLPYFVKHGYIASAMSLRGHGRSAGREKLRWTSIQDYVEDVAQVARTYTNLPVLIAHSMGGYVVQKYLERYPAAGVVFLATLPAGGTLPFTLRSLWHHPRPFLKASISLNLYELVATPELVQAQFFSPSMSDAQVRAYHARMGGESFRVLLDSLVLARPQPGRVPRNIPKLVLAAENDRVFSLAEQQATADAYHAPLEIFPDMAHDMMLEAGWEAVAQRILRWLHEEISPR